MLIAANAAVENPMKPDGMSEAGDWLGKLRRARASV